MWTQRQKEQDVIIQYEPCTDGVRILRCFSQDRTEQLIIPDRLGGLPVREIGAYAFSHAEGKKELEEKEGILSAVGGDQLRDIYLPETLERIGRLAFYNCENLRKLVFYDTVREIEDGAFKNCGKLSQIQLYAVREKINCKKQVVVDVEQKVEAVIEYKREGKKAKLIFPEFGYGFEENCPGRIFHEYTYGSGSSYRQCFYDNAVRYQRYDELFGMATREDPAETVMEIALGRLEYPYRLSERDREKYEAYLKGHRKETCGILIGREDLDTLKLLFSWNIVGEDDLDGLIEQAGRRQKLECLSWLMDRKLSSGIKKKKRFEF